LQLSSGIVTILLAGMLLSGLLITDRIVILFFGLWILFSGTNRIVASLVMIGKKLYGWPWSLASGILSISLGIIAGTEVLADSFTLVMIIGFTFLLEGTNTIIAGILLKPRGDNHQKRGEKS
jgi:uncharacterized membrane protein HdeD (DUF308 family)